jgi:hypothetical protein
VSGGKRGVDDACARSAAWVDCEGGDIGEDGAR